MLVPMIAAIISLGVTGASTVAEGIKEMRPRDALASAVRVIGESPGRASDGRTRKDGGPLPSTATPGRSSGTTTPSSAISGTSTPARETRPTATPSDRK